MDSLPLLVSAALRSLIVLILARAAWHKVHAFHETTGFAQSYGLVPAFLTPPIIRALTGAEVIAVVLLLLPGAHPLGALLAAGLFAGYGVLMALALGQGRTEIDCGCGGAPQVVSGLTVGRNALLTVTALAVAGIAPDGPISVAGAALAITAGLTFFATYCVAEKLASHLPNIRRAR